jgi:hypothetical protein
MTCVLVGKRHNQQNARKFGQNQNVGVVIAILNSTNPPCSYNGAMLSGFLCYFCILDDGNQIIGVICNGTFVV